MTTPEAEAPVPTALQRSWQRKSLLFRAYPSLSSSLSLTASSSCAIPESITTEGLSSLLGVRDDRLTDISPAAFQENLALYRSVYDLLLQYDRSSLSPEQQVSYDVYAWYLDDLLRMGAYPYSDYPVNPLVVTGVQNLLEYLFVEYHAIDDLEAPAITSRASRRWTRKWRSSARRCACARSRATCRPPS